MNNDQFRRLVSDTPRVDRSQNGGAPSATPALGSRQRASIPMTPRSLGSGGSNDFARQVAAHRAAQNPKKERKFRSAAPLGSKLPEGYIDRAKAVRDGTEDDTAATKPVDDNEKRLIALMDLVREGKMDKDMAIEQTKLLGGDVSSTHLVKGLDRTLLERARRGEDLLGKVVIGKERIEEDENEEKEVEMDVDDELDKALEKEVVVTTRGKKGEKEDDDNVTNDVPKKRTRAEILEELKKSRAAASLAIAAPVLGSKFKKIAEKVPKNKKSSTVSSLSSKQNGSTNTQHINKKLKTSVSSGITEVDITKPVLGMLPPPLPASAKKSEIEDDDDGDIFADAGADYDPLAGILSDDDSDSDSNDEKKNNKKETEETLTPENADITTLPLPSSSSIPAISTPSATSTSMPPPPPPPTPVVTSTNPTPLTAPRNYFSTPSSSTSSSSTPVNPLDNADLLAAIKKASLLSAAEAAVNQQDQQSQPSAKHQAMLSASRRDDADVDMGFGGSRTFGDDDDDEGPVEDEDGGKGGAGGKKRKRKKKVQV